MQTNIANIDADFKVSAWGAIRNNQSQWSKLEDDKIDMCRSCSHVYQRVGDIEATGREGVPFAHALTLMREIESMRVRIRELETIMADKTHGYQDPHSLSLPTSYWGKKEFLPDDDDLIKLPTGTALPKNLNRLSESQDPRLQVARHFDHPDLSVEIIYLAATFPLGMKNVSYDKSIFEPFIPSRDFAQKWSDAYFNNHGWAYKPIRREDYQKNVFEPIYSRPIESIHTHNLAVFFALVSYGLSTELTSEAKKLVLLSKACLAFTPVVLEATYWAVLALWFLLRVMYTYQHGSEAVWLGTGFACRIASIIGLDRDGSNSGSDEEVQRKRLIFWELFGSDQHEGIMYRRPPYFNLRYVDCPFPSLPPGETAENDWTYQTWRFQYAATCVQSVAEHIYSVQKEKPEYSAVLDLDLKIKTFPVPLKLQISNIGSEHPHNLSDDPATAMQQISIIFAKDATLMYLHRSCAREALQSQPLNPLEHTFAPSVLTTFDCALRVIRSLKALYLRHRLFALQYWFCWSLVFTSCTILSRLVIRSPLCPLAELSLSEFDDGLALYSEGLVHCNQRTNVETLIRVREQAYEVFRAAREEKDLAPLSGQGPTMEDELYPTQSKGTDLNSLPVPPFITSNPSESSIILPPMIPPSLNQSAPTMNNDVPYVDYESVLAPLPEVDNLMHFGFTGVSGFDDTSSVPAPSEPRVSAGYWGYDGGLLSPSSFCGETADRYPFIFEHGTYESPSYSSSTEPEPEQYLLVDHDSMDFSACDQWTCDVSLSQPDTR